jgi:hypothetical protein
MAMSRIAVIAITAALLFVGFCCPPPALALEKQPQMMVCPLTGQTCETREADCDPPPPQLATTFDAPVKIITPDVDALPAAPELAPPHESPRALLSHWTAPNRTVVLRI